MHDGRLCTTALEAGGQAGRRAARQGGADSARALLTIMHPAPAAARLPKATLESLEPATLFPPTPGSAGFLPPTEGTRRERERERERVADLNPPEFERIQGAFPNSVKLSSDKAHLAH
jgi:hypothetical protein